MLLFLSKVFIPLSIFLSYGNAERDLDQTQDLPNIVWRHGYHFEEHIVKTSDGWNLKLFRIPAANNSLTTPISSKKPVLLQHGLLADASTWVISKNDSIAFVLADAGYDVWMGNYRGCHYSLDNDYYNRREYGFWDFSWDEMAEHDLPEFIKYIWKSTGKKISYVGHSMGTTTFFASMSEHPENAEMIASMTALAPIVYMKGAKGVITLLTPFAKNVNWISRVLGVGEFLPNDSLTDIFVKYICTIWSFTQKVCQNLLFVATGYDKTGFNNDLFENMISHLPSSASVKTVMQYSQEKGSGNFAHYDLGTNGNMQKYGQATPPQYNMSKVTVPVCFFWGPNDWLSHKNDAHRAYNELPNGHSFYPIASKTFNHMDFMFAKNLKELLLDPMLAEDQCIKTYA